MTTHLAHHLPPAPAEDMLAPMVAADDPFAAELRFTDTYRRFRDEPIPIREARCLAVQFPEVLCPIEPGDLLAGRIRPRLVGFTPDEWGNTAFGYYHLPEAIDDALRRFPLSRARAARVRRMRAFWDEESTAAKLRHGYPDELARWLPSDKWMTEPGVAFPLYRITGATPDYGKLVRLGLPGLRAEIVERRRGAESEACDLYDGMALALDTVADVCRHYEVEAAGLAETAADPSRRQELRQLAAALRAITLRAPRGLLEAAQLVWLYALVADLRNHGRMDVYLAGPLADDLAAGRLDEADALHIVQSLWRLMAARRTRVHNRVIVGGAGRPDPAAADRFALLAIEASRTVLEPEPQLSLRLCDGQDAALWDAALDSIGDGRTYPMLYNDAVNVPAAMRSLDIGHEDAEQYVPFGCGELIVEHRGLGTPSGVLNLLKALEVTLRDGVDPTTGRRIGLPLGRLDDFASFDDLWRAYTHQVEHFVRLAADQAALEYRVAGREWSALLMSALTDDCLARGRGALDGGVRFLGATLETYGNTNTADSLTAIRELVYEQRRISPEQLLGALDADFAEHALERRLLRDAPKYGNDDQTADDMLLRVDRHVCDAVAGEAARVGLHSYRVVIINNSANTLMGHHTAASADGRLAGTPMNNGNAPSGGNDRLGPTALLNSLAKLDAALHAGAVQNLSLAPELFTGHRAELEALLRGYFERGGSQAMITVVNRADLERAMRDPDSYRHLFVRVGGFSARFVDLSRDVQLEILSRVVYGR
jgi:pyruvate-formate lyase